MNITGLPIYWPNNPSEGRPVCPARRCYGHWNISDGITMAITDDGQVWAGAAVEEATCASVLQEICPRGKLDTLQCSVGNYLFSGHVFQRANDSAWSGEEEMYPADPALAAELAEKWDAEKYEKDLVAAREQGAAEERARQAPERPISVPQAPPMRQQPTPASRVILTATSSAPTSGPKTNQELPSLPNRGDNDPPRKAVPGSELMP